jgi:hypothetical protein
MKGREATKQAKQDRLENIFEVYTAQAKVVYAWGFSQTTSA